MSLKEVQLQSCLAQLHQRGCASTAPSAGLEVGCFGYFSTLPASGAALTKFSSADPVQVFLHPVLSPGFRAS